MRLRILAFATLLLAASDLAAAELEVLQSVTVPPLLHVVDYQGNGWAATAGDGRLVRWNNAPGQRAEVQATWDETPTGLETWGDSLAVHLGDTVTRLIYPEGPDYIWNLEKPAGWHLPNAIIDGTPYRVFVDPAYYVLVYSAPGFGTILGLLDLNQQIGPQTMGAHAGAAAVVGSVQGAYTVDLSEPLLPTIASDLDPPVPGQELKALAMSPGRVHLLWDGLLQTYDVDAPAFPLLLDEIACAGSGLVASDDWVVAYTPETGAMQAFSLSAQGVLSPAAAGTSDLAFMGAPQLHGNRVVVQDSSGLRAFQLSTTPDLADVGLGWTPIPSGRWLAHDGWAWCLSDRRRTGYRHRGEPLLTAWPFAGDLVDAQLDDDLLVTAVADGVQLDRLPAVEDDPTGWLPVASPVRAVAASGSLVAVATEASLDLVNAGDPAAPQLVGSLPLTDPAVAVALTSRAAVAAVRPADAGDDLLVVDTAVPDAPALASQVTLDHGENPWQVLAAVPSEAGVQVLCRHADEVRGVTVGLDDLSAPGLVWSEPDPVFWCYDAVGLPLADPRPTRLGNLHVASRGDTVTCYQGPPDALVAVTSWLAPAPVTNLAASGNVLVVVTTNRLDLLTYSDGTLVSVPQSRLATDVRAVPNPFNPLTELRFDLPAGGRSVVTVHDLQGRLVRTLAVDGPAGPRRVPWDGRADDGRSLPSGQYLLRVVSGDGVQTGRCTLIR